MSEGFTIRHRGGGALREFLCPEHGVFETRDAGDEQPCPAIGFAMPQRLSVDARGGIRQAMQRCNLPSPRCFTSAPAVHTAFVVSAVRGKDDPKPHARAMDLRPLAEGQSHQAWRAERAKMWAAEDYRRRKDLRG
jgi:hypothetical protein